MFQDLKKFNKIFVTGLARSGTRIATRMIAHDTGKTFIDETEWGIVDIPKLEHHNKYRDNFVVHAVCAYFCMHKFTAEDTLVVFVKRDLADIKKSWERIRTDDLDTQKILWKNPPKEATLPMEDRLALWDIERNRIINLMEINYEDLKDHPMWLDKEKRQGFFWHQTVENQFDKAESKVIKNL